MEIKHEHTHKPINTDICFIFYECCRVPTCSSSWTGCVYAACVCVSRMGFLCTVDLQRRRSFGSPHAVFCHARVRPFVLLSHLQQTESIVTADLESTPTQRKRTNHSFVVWGIAHTLAHQSSPPNHYVILKLFRSFPSAALWKGYNRVYYDWSVEFIDRCFILPSGKFQQDPQK